MKYIHFLAIVVILCLSASCGDNEDNSDSDNTEYRDKMRSFVIDISQYAKAKKTDFAIIPQNGIELVTEDCYEDGNLATNYTDAIDGHGQEDLFYGYDDDNIATPAEETNYMKEFLDKSKAAGNVILVTDYCSTPSKVEDAISKNKAAGYIGYVAIDRELNRIPSTNVAINNENTADITSLSQVQNFLYLINPELYTSKQAFISALSELNYDLLIIDLFFDGDVEFTAQEIASLKTKKNGGKRMVVCYMSIGEAEDYRYYWQNSWIENPPSWMDEENTEWEGNYKVKYWDEGWQSIIYGNNSAYLDKIISAGFDGVYLDIIEAFEYYE